ncbi:glycine zipper 2TM domain-containing protein [Phenylobacterium sp. LjRoot219]|uniref:glycine zipper 2TM domain-containing protein n=1 Tax=Phenylobacterium sp. LjRoot219 TaxID=3342283 RepID=UPI003ECF9D40
MRIQTLVAGVCAAALLPTAAFAQQTCEQRQNNRVAGTIAGAGLGALAGSAVAGRGDRTEGAVIGGVAGALLGNQLTKGQADCTRAYGYYDNNGAWHANAVAGNTAAAGYFDRNGVWVEGAPRGHYDRDGRWVQASQDASAAGYHDARGLWVPASASGYYTNDGRWVAAAAPGYYDRSGRWVAGAAIGRYNADGQWIAGQASGRRDAAGVWVADPQPGYYDNGRWVRGEAIGYYDARGRWISTDGRHPQRADYSGSRGVRSIDERQADLAQRIDRAMETGRLTPAEGQQAMRTLASIKRDERSLRNRQGVLGPRAQVTINARLDRLDSSIREDVRDHRNGRYSSR